MSIFNRAYLYIIRKKVRSSILFLIVTLISFFLLSGSVLNTTVNNISKNLYKDVNFGFNIESVDKSNKEIEKDTLKKIEELKGITTKNYIFSKPVNVEGKKVVQENQNITLNDEIKNNSNLVMLNGITASKSNIDFKSEVLKLEKGRHIEENDNNKIMIHEKFAELNHVNLGDKIKLSQEGKTLELEVVGIYSGEKTNTFNGLSSDFIENTVYTDYKSSQELSNLIANNKVTSVEYGVEDPTKLDDVIKNVENLGINNLMVSKSNKNYELVTSSVESITKITNMIRIGSVVVGVVILSLILMFWVRERTYEIGILLSLGTSKVNLVLQFIVEVLLVTIVGLMIAIGIEIATIKYLASNVGSIFSEELPKSIADELMKMSVNGIDIVNLGHKIKLSQEGKTLELEIVGIYSGEKTNTFNGLSSDFIENTVYTDYKSSQELSNLIANNKVTSVEYGVEDPTKLDDVIKTVENLGINNLMVSKSNKNYELVTSSVESITKITNMIRIGSVVIGVVILSLILMFWVRERTYEIGILLSLGTSKVNLVLQFIVEVILVTIFGLMIALGIEIATIKYLASNVGSIFSEELPKSIADELMKMPVNGIDIVNLVIVMIAIVIISVVVALLPILKMKPKKILTNIN